MVTKDKVLISNPAFKRDAAQARRPLTLRQAAIIMTHSSLSQNLPQSFSLLKLTVGVTLGLCIFAGTFFAYADMHKNLQGSYLPAVLGVIAFTALMALLNYFTLSDRILLFRVSKAVGIALLEAIVFFYLLMLLLLNTFGS